MWFLENDMSIAKIFTHILAILAIIFIVLPFHEWAHGYAAYKLGDPTAKRCGRLTFNPLASIDPIGAVIMLFFGIGWAKPVPVDSRFFRKPKRDMAIVAACGPLANLIAALIGVLIVKIVIVPTFYGTLFADFIYFYIQVNIYLAAFNLLPIPPLDGSRILTSILPDRVTMKYFEHQSIFVIITLLMLFSGMLRRPMNFLAEYFHIAVVKIANIIWPFS